MLCRCAVVFIGFCAGADPEFSVCPTSYDCDAPLTEAGDITDKYLAIRNFTLQVLQRFPYTVTYSAEMKLCTV